jgi:Secretion system C-terminal sorting domain
MRKNFTYLFVGFLFLTLNLLNGQTVVWPTADSATIRASQFSDSALIFKSTAANPNPPTGFTGWISKGTSGTGVVKDNTQWDWTRDGKGNKGSLWSTRLAISSSTASNGAAIFNSDFLDSKGNNSFGAGVSPSPHSAELWSPVIDLTGKDGITVTFRQYFRTFDYGLTGVSWSEDGGTTWKDTIEVMDNLPSFRFLETDNQVAMKLKGSKGSAKFRIKFIFDGDYYFWIIDDVRLMQMDNNLRVNRNWFATPQNLVMPRHQVDSIYFMADIENQGNKAATNVKLTVDIRQNSTGASVFTTSKNYGNLQPDFVAENGITGKWLPPNTGTATVGYTGFYIVSSDNPDNFAANDTVRFAFNLSDSLRQNETGTNTRTFRPGNGNWGATEPHSWKVGQYYYFPRGSKITATRIRAFVDTSSIAGSTLTAVLYKWRDINNDGIVQSNEREIVAAGESKVPIAASPTAVDFILENFSSSGPVILKDTSAYLAMLEFTPLRTGVDMFIPWSEAIATAPMIYVTDSVSRPRYNTIINYDGVNNAEWNTRSGFVGDALAQLQPLVRIWSWPTKTDTKEPLSANNKIELYPNPAQNTLNVSFDLEKVESAVLVRIIDMQGRILKERDYDNVQKDNIPFDISALQNGIYNVQIQTIGNYRTMRLVIAK